MAVYDPRGGGDVHVDEVLTNISVGYQNESFISEQLAPAVPVRKQTDKYRIFGKEGWVLEPGDDYRAPGAEANEIPGLTVSTDTYFCQEHALRIAVTDEERENADSPLAPDRDGTELVTDKILLQRELRVRDLVYATGNYPAGSVVTLAGTDQWNDYANSDPIGDYKTGRDVIHSQLFMHPTKTVVPYQVMSTLEDHTDFIERIKYSQAGVLTPEIVARVMGSAQFIVPGAGYNSANMGQAESLAYIWGKNVLMAYVPPRAGMRIPAFMYEFVWKKGGRDQVTTRWRAESRGADVIQVARRYDHKFIAKDASNDSLAGYLIVNAIA